MIKNSTYLLLFIVVLYTACNDQKPINYITDFGAKGNNITLNTQYIQQAIDDLDRRGGGTLVIPQGKFITGTIRLKSNIHYRFENGAMLIGSPNINDYNQPSGESNVMFIRYIADEIAKAKSEFRVLIDATEASNISLTGPGIIEGNGQYFWDEEFKALERPEPWISFRQSKNITVSDITFQNAPSHVLRFEQVENVVIDKIKIFNVAKSPNTDGIDLLDSKNIHISNSHIATGDDAICLKTNENKTLENITVMNCILESDDAAIKFGTGSAGIIRYTTFSNNVIRNSRYGVSLFMLEGGTFEHNLFSNLVMSGGSRHKQEYPIFIDVDKKKPEHAYGTIRHNTFSDIKIETTGKILITGRPEKPIQNLVLDNITYHVTAEADFVEAKKPRGNKNFPKLETSIDRSSIQAHLTLGYIDGLVLNGFYFSNDGTLKRSQYDFLEVEFSKTLP